MIEHYEPVSPYLTLLEKFTALLNTEPTRKILRYKQQTQRSYLPLYRFSHATTRLAILATSCTCDWLYLANVSLYQHRLGGILHRKKSSRPAFSIHIVICTELNYCAFKLMHFIIYELLGIPEILYQVLL